MARKATGLTDLSVRRLSKPGRYADGEGLYLVVDAKGKRWLWYFRQDGRRREMGLGSAANVSLTEAREARKSAARHLAEGRDPIVARDAEREARRIAEEAALRPAATFAHWAREQAPVLAPKSAKVRSAWIKMMTEWVGPVKDRPLAEVTTEDVLAALKPYWKSRPETARRMRARIERVLDSARAKGLIAGAWENPARWKGHLEFLIEQRQHKVRHHPAIPYEQMPAFYQAIANDRDGMAAHALRFLILTVGRTSEVIYARWSELDADVWTCPAERMKMHREHRVPLVKEALDILEAVKPPLRNVRGSDWVFPSLHKKGKPLSTGAMERVLDRMGWGGKATVHGFRSSFRDWAGDCTNFDRGTIEAALAHLVGDETERAYRRGDALLKRRKLMEAWSGFLNRKVGSNVAPLARPSPR